MPTLRFTKRAVEQLPQPAKGQVLYRDEVLRGFGLRVGSASKNDGGILINQCLD